MPVVCRLCEDSMFRFKMKRCNSIFVEKKARHASAKLKMMRQLFVKISTPFLIHAVLAVAVVSLLKQECVDVGKQIGKLILMQRKHSYKPPPGFRVTWNLHPPLAFTVSLVGMFFCVRGGVTRIICPVRAVKPSRIELNFNK